MPEFIKDVIDDVVDEFWPDIEEEIIYFICLKVNKPYTIVPSEKDWCLPCFLVWPWKAVRAWYLYTTMPCK